MIVILGILSLVIALLLESRYSYITRFRKTKFGKIFFGSRQAIFFSQFTLLFIIAGLVSVFRMPVNQFDVIVGLVGGHLIALIIVAQREDLK
ncbi:hypothetical protein EZV73_18560 [Acidaminobacter sp. JC074]|uniref:hypothetical protein n=1 Tax=Acidaminobacter sp. JC074 TaxID=2530199 RepID=UPI001F0E01A8|nr:hypothetical protein [Acidaminobacter sp. JC074]MCH4889591.1 hypothetical protein [Acidaminobacter sp. JC074]